MTRFDFSDVASHFDQHISDSIPGYAQLIDTILALSGAFIQPHGRVYDIGCSTGALLKKIEQRHADVELLGYDIEPAFAKHWHRHYCHVNDIRDVSIDYASLVLSLFTLQFLPPGDRQALLCRIHRGMLEGGALIIAEKTHYPTGAVQALATTGHLQQKRRRFSDTAILDKDAALLPVMRPTTAAHTERQLRAAGFATVEPIWQALHFRAWVAIKTTEPAQ